MLTFRHVDTFTSASHRWLARITDLLIVPNGDAPILMVATHIGGGISSYRITATAGLEMMRSRPWPDEFGYQREPAMMLHQVNGRNYVHMAGFSDATHQPVEVRAHNGALAPFGATFPANALGRNITSMGVVNDLIWSAGANGLTVAMFRADGAAVTRLSSARLAVAEAAPGAQIDTVAPAMVEGRQFLIAASGLGNSIGSFRLTDAGKLIAAAVHDGRQELGYDLPNQIGTAQI
ncbi:hypothetical protein, partial [Paracoccus sp. (in: a-proteobacteria)]|uniref:hypothetical protein n=1 Tax=Paracoccus sp. TaxID=267 RepID=UPI0026E0E236